MAAGVGVRGVVVGEGVEVEVVVGLEVEVGEGDGSDVGRLSGVGDGDGLVGGTGVVSVMESVAGGGDVDSTGCVCAMGSGVGAWPHPPSVRVDARASSAAARVIPRKFVNGDLSLGERWLCLKGKRGRFVKVYTESLKEWMGWEALGTHFFRFRLLPTGRHSIWKSNPCLRSIVLGVGFV